MSISQLSWWQKALLALGALAALTFIAYVLSQGLGRDSKTIMIFASLIAVAPVLIYMALKWPMLFPFCFFVMLVPFDQLLGLSKFGTVTRFLAIASAFPILFWMVRNRTANKFPKALLAWWVLCIWMVLTALWAIDPSLTFARTQTFLQLLLLYAVLALMPIGIRELRVVLLSSLIGGVTGAAYGAWFFYHNLGSIMKRLLLSNGQDVLDPNHLGASLLLPIAIVTVFAMSARSLWVKLFFVVADIVLFGAIYASGSRGSFVAIAVMFAYLIWSSRQRVQIGIVAVISVAAGLLMPTSLWTRFSGALSSGGAGRTDIWRVGWVAFRQHWLAGAGFSNFTLAYSDAYLHAYQHVAQGWARAPHNLIVNLGVELGLIGLVLLLVAWGTQFTMLSGIPRSSPLYDYRLIAQASLLGLFASGMFLDVLYTKYTWLTFIVGALTYTVWKTQQPQHVVPTMRPLEPSYVYFPARRREQLPAPLGSEME